MPNRHESVASRYLGHGVHLIDAMYIRPGLVAIYLIEHDGRVAFIETGTTHSMPQVLAALRNIGLTADAVDYVIPTHVHLDHAGGAGAMMAAFPQARLILHPRGARHMINPSRLLAGTIEVYGEATAHRLYGEVIPVAAERIIEATDGMQVDLNGRSFTILDTPGHAKHHCCIFDQQTRGIFSGDTFGLSYRELDVDGQPSALITTTPTEFDPDAMRSSLNRLLALDPESLYMTHFSQVAQVDRVAGMLYRQLDEHVRIAERNALQPAENRLASISNDLESFFRNEGKRIGWRISDEEFERVLMPDVRLNAKGLVSWLGQRHQPPRGRC
jgi:glyoxylase-like metal-dependent hydrolase (beta-lactamase superfamily II)